MDKIHGHIIVQSQYAGDDRFIAIHADGQLKLSCHSTYSLMKVDDEVSSVVYNIPPCPLYMSMG